MKIKPNKAMKSYLKSKNKFTKKFDKYLDALKKMQKKWDNLTMEEKVDV